MGTCFGEIAANGKSIGEVREFEELMFKNSEA